jgi:hypothetical protein
VATDLKEAVPEEGLLDLEKGSEVPGRMAGKPVPKSLEDMCGIGNAAGGTKTTKDEREKITKAEKSESGGESADRTGPLWETWSNS